MSKRPRKPPRPHRVNPQDPRYSNGVKATGYPRGSCGGVPRMDGSGGGVRNHNANIVRTIRTLSSGTMATLTGKKKYKELDIQRDMFARYVQFSPKKYETWKDAWDDWNRPSQKSTIIYADSKTEAVEKVSKKGKVLTAVEKGVNHMGNLYYEVTYVPQDIYDEWTDRIKRYP